MKGNKKIILAVNPGSTSMKIALYADKECQFEQNLKMNLMDVVADFEHYDMNTESNSIKLIISFLEHEGYKLDEIDLVASRGGPAMPMKSGAYFINELFLDTFKYAPKVKHPSIIGPAIARCIADQIGVSAIVYDSDSVDEAGEMEHITGIPEITRTLSSHLLNGKMMCIELAEKIGKKYKDCNILALHLGGGISVAAYSGGKVVDSLFVDDGPMTPNRSGILPVRQLIHLCYSGKYTEKEMQKFIISNGGLISYFGTSDCREIEEMIHAGDKKVEMVYKAMAYQTAKCVGQMAVVLSGEIDAILITGGLANSIMLTDWIKEWIGFLGPIYVMPGEEEMKALCLGGLRVLNGEEEVYEYTTAPEPYETVEEFYKKINKK